MHKIQSGSTLLIVLFVSSILVIVMTSVWRTTNFFQQSAYMRQQVYQAQYSTHACVYRACALCWSSFQDCYNLLPVHQELLVLESTAWPVDDKRTAHARIYAQRHEQKIKLRAELSDLNGALLWRVQCLCTPTAVMQWFDMPR